MPGPGRLARGMEFACAIGMKKSSGHPKVSPLGKELLAYMESHPRAADSLEGIVEWWMLERDIRRRTEEVRRTLAELVRHGLVEEIGDGSSIRYRRKRERGDPDQSDPKGEGRAP
jgi:hypothetical protein